MVTHRHARALQLLQSLSTSRQYLVALVQRPPHDLPAQSARAAHDQDAGLGHLCGCKDPPLRPGPRSADVPAPRRGQGCACEGGVAQPHASRRSVGCRLPVASAATPARCRAGAGGDCWLPQMGGPAAMLNSGCSSHGSQAAFAGSQISILLRGAAVSRWARRSGAASEAAKQAAALNAAPDSQAQLLCCLHRQSWHAGQAAGQTS